MITVQININGNCIFARSATRKDDFTDDYVANYEVDDGNFIEHIPDDGVIALAHKLLDCIKENKK